MSNGATINPLGPNHLQTLNTVLQGCSACSQILERCKRAGVDVSSMEAELRAQHQLAAGIKREFFPGEL